VPTSETRQICPGDSTFVFGNFVKTAGVFAQNFANANGCDSTHTISVNLFSAPIPTSETRQICPGDSTFVFGNFVKTAGVFAQKFPNTNGCDSTHSVTVSLFQVPIPTSEIRQICPGDSTLIFGNFEKTAGIFAQNFANTNGCDSTHSIIVNVFPGPVPTNETRQICTGDSTLVFGNFVNTPGIFTQNFDNANGCDSLHTIEVSEVSMYTQADSVALCPGDSVLVFGNWISQSIAIQEIVPGLLGCDTLWTIAVQAIVAPAISLQISQPDAQYQNGKVEAIGGSGALYSLDGLQYDAQGIFDSLPAGSYVLYQSFEGCIQEAPFVILPFLEAVTTGVFVPNIFAPGSSNGNAQFTLYATPGLVNQLSWLRIYDRWGSLVFEQKNLPPNDESKGWDGLINGQRAAPGVYFWQAMVEYSSGAGELKKGDLTVIR
ncbi:MAG: gliding motility-associated C-terminal domain-containing protein, partial [Saprospiraceae bacterium]